MVTLFSHQKSNFRALCSETVKKGSFSKLFLGFHFWTFLTKLKNVHFSKPLRLLFLLLLLRKREEKYDESLYHKWLQNII